MSRNATVTAPFGDKKYDFRLGIEQLVEHDRLCDAGPEFILRAIYEGSWRVPYIRETIRLGLIGAEMDPMTALVMVDTYAGPGHLMPLKPLATSILAAAVMGVAEEAEDDQPGKRRGRKKAPSPVES